MELGEGIVRNEETSKESFSSSQVKKVATVSITIKETFDVLDYVFVRGFLLILGIIGAAAVIVHALKSF